MKSSLSFTLLYLLLPLSQSLPVNSLPDLLERSAQDDKQTESPIPVLEIGDLSPFGVEIPEVGDVSDTHVSLRRLHTNS
jgi:hypothetical protein